MMRSVLSAAAPIRAAAAQQTREMATLKEIRLRLKSVTSIAKITKSMKMVSAAKFARAERSLRAVKPIGPASQALFTRTGAKADETTPKQLVVTVSSDRGLCGGIHSGICRKVRADILATPSGNETKIATVGDKTRGILARTHSSYFLLSSNEVGRLPPTFAESSFVAQEILNSGYEYDVASIYYNKFKSAVSYSVERADVPSAATVLKREELNVYDDVDGDVLKDYVEFSLASNLYYAQIEGQASEQSSRMTAMENASSNAGDMIESLRLTFNRTRQAVITNELTEIVSGAAALE